MKQKTNIIDCGTPSDAKLALKAEIAKRKATL